MTNRMEETFNRLESRQSSGILLRVPVVHHRVLKAYARSIGKSVNAVLAVLVEQLVEEVQHQFIVPLSVVEPTSYISEEDRKERAIRFANYKQAHLNDPSSIPEEFGLALISGNKGNNINHFTVDRSMTSLTVSSTEPVTLSNGNGHTSTVDNDPI